MRACLVCTILLASMPAWAGSPVILHRFQGGQDGATPEAALIAGPDGTLYGTTQAGGGGNCNSPLDQPGCGTVFAMVKRSDGHWDERILYRFASADDGLDPAAPLLRDAAGNLYGTTVYGGANAALRACGLGCGTVFRLSPPAHGNGVWTKTILYNFKGAADGDMPLGQLTADFRGALYGVESGDGPHCFYCGSVFRLDPPAGAASEWTKTTLHDFTGGVDGAYPAAGVLAGPDGTLYGTTTFGGHKNSCGPGNFGCGVVYALRPPGPGETDWREQVLHSFTGGQDGGNPQCMLIRDGEGALYGAAVSPGTPPGSAPVFQLLPAPGGTAWTFTVLHDFSALPGSIDYPSNLVLDGKENLLGVYDRVGLGLEVVHSFELIRPLGNNGVWREKPLERAVLHRASGSVNQPLVQEGAALFGTTPGIGPSDVGTVFVLTP